MKKRITFYTLFIVLILAQFSYAQNDQIDLITNWFTGEYTTSEQAAIDSQIIDLHLDVTAFKIQKEKGQWFYLETAFTSSLETPYKQEVYHFYIASLGYINIDRYSIENGDAYFHAFKDSTLLTKLTKEQLTFKNRCSIIVTKSKDIFVGKSSGSGCASKLRNAKYSKIDVEFTEDDFFLWERGFNASNKQVWGPTENGYIFKKILSEK